MKLSSSRKPLIWDELLNSQATLPGFSALEHSQILISYNPFISFFKSHVYNNISLRYLISYLRTIHPFLTFDMDKSNGTNNSDKL